MNPTMCAEIELNGEKLELYSIVGCTGYAVTRSGRVFSRWKRPQPPFKEYILSDRWKELKPSKKESTSRIELKHDDGHKRRIPVSHIVLETFVGPRPEGMEACHFPNRDVTDNRVENLRWDNHQANLADRAIHGTLLLGEKHHQCKITDEQMADLLERMGSGETCRSLATRFHVTIQRIYQIRDKWGR